MHHQVRIIPVVVHKFSREIQKYALELLKNETQKLGRKEKITNLGIKAKHTSDEGV